MSHSFEINAFCNEVPLKGKGSIRMHCTKPIQETAYINYFPKPNSKINNLDLPSSGPSTVSFSTSGY